MHKALRNLAEGFSDLSNIRTGKIVGTGDLGTGKTIRPDAKLLAASWFRTVGVSGTQEEWVEFAKRSGVFPEDIDRGWKFLEPLFASLKTEPSTEYHPVPSSQVSRPVDDVRDRIKVGEALIQLRYILGEAVPWGGYSVPNPEMTNMPQGPNPGFGFHTKTAEEVWAAAKRIADEDEKATTDSIIQKAIEQSDSLITELTPEDVRMLEMAINWYLAGKEGGMTAPQPPYGGNKTAGARGDASTMGRAT